MTSLDLVFWHLPAVGWDTNFKTSEPQRQLHSGSEQIQPNDAERQSKATAWWFMVILKFDCPSYMG